jgi:succinate dehydrogenase flavin-adding protein (antitoxin of CptAB toxin-antitoxin module)
MSEEQYVKLVLNSDRIEPPFSAQYVNNLTEEQIEKMYKLIGMEFAARDAKLLISFMGNSEITDVIKEMFTMFYVSSKIGLLVEPLLIICSA